MKADIRYSPYGLPAMSASQTTGTRATRPMHTQSHIVSNLIPLHSLHSNVIVVNTDVLYFSETAPEILTVGCNQGKVDTFLTIDPDTISNGAYTADQVAKNPLCFATEFALAELPALTGLGTVALAPLTKVFNSITSELNCASIGSVNTSALAACPGFTLYGGPTAPVAKGAIQS